MDFYVGVLGLRLVKRSVNQDAPDTYHLFYADGRRHLPGTDLTFFPWPNMGPARAGTGLTVEVSFAVSPGSLDYWQPRLEQAGVRTPACRGDPLRRAHAGLSRTRTACRFALVETAEPRRVCVPWEQEPGAGSTPTPRDACRALLGTCPRPHSGTAHQIDGLHRGRRRGRLAPLRGDRRRLGRVRRGEGAALPQGPGRWGTGGVHHVAWHRAGLGGGAGAAQHAGTGRPAVPRRQIDRFWFRSVYFREPGGVLFELATDGPGFDRDEDMAHLGEQFDPAPLARTPAPRAIEAGLPPLTMPPGPG